MNTQESHLEGTPVSAQHLYIDTRALLAYRSQNTLRTIHVSGPTWRHSQALNMLIFEQDSCLAGETPASSTIHVLIGTLLTRLSSDSARGTNLEAHGLHVFPLKSTPSAHVLESIVSNTLADARYHTCLHVTGRSFRVSIWSSLVINIQDLFILDISLTFTRHNA